MFIRFLKGFHRLKLSISTYFRRVPWIPSKWNIHLRSLLLGFDAYEKVCHSWWEGSSDTFLSKPPEVCNSSEDQYDKHSNESQHYTSSPSILLLDIQRSNARAPKIRPFIVVRTETFCVQLLFFTWHHNTDPRTINARAGIEVGFNLVHGVIQSYHNRLVVNMHNSALV